MSKFLLDTAEGGTFMGKQVNVATNSLMICRITMPNGM
jgi:hypothetical protein